MFIFLHCISDTCMNVVFIKKNNLRSPLFPHFAPIQVFRHDNTNIRFASFHADCQDAEHKAPNHLLMTLSGDCALPWQGY